ncbi:glycoprotein 3-alpha-L-fucosyltransferase A-like [Dendronephthya gigantea]|uniref:glycoprotein 3-alpha-L-fucosyltransferase A-like n=1 Tax=Dendronephthya gigantea TaxID=151771 RepID=UPI00106B35FE|nr:glycoprotein 3-alpha-L-fucosyltransferase A-like [Dendronephthya gigantea]
MLRSFGIVSKKPVACFKSFALVFLALPGYLLYIFHTSDKYENNKNVFPIKNQTFTILNWCPTFFSSEMREPVNLYVDNCFITRDRSLLDVSDFVVIDVRELGGHLQYMPQSRSTWQRWIYFNVESPFHAILKPVGFTMSDFRGKYAFNWTMTYRTDADVPMLHGWKLNKSENEKKETDIDGIVRNKTKLAAVLLSNCYYVKNGRGQFVKELQKYMEVDVYGKCGDEKLKCEGYYINKGCEKIKTYKFYLAFENSNCRDYISEKMWMQGFDNYAVPVVMGAYKEDYIEHVRVPPNSIIHVNDFDSPKELAEYLKMLDKNDTAYRELHKWRETYKVGYEFRFMGTYAWSTLCSKLNKLNSKFIEEPKWHKTITDFEHPSKDCYLHKWVKKQCNNNPYNCR